MNHLNPIDDVASAAESSVPADVEIDSTWVLVTSFSALLVILGFAFLASGAVRYKSVQSAVITILLGSVVAILSFWILGYGFAFGDDQGNKFIGFSRFAGAGFGVDDSRDDYTNFIFQSVGAIIVASLFGLGTLERSRFFSVSLTTIFLAGFLYPVVLHWVAPKVGWLNLFGYIDFAGSGYIHLFGATTALVVSFFLKERRDSQGNVHPGIFPHHAPINIGYGSLLVTIANLVFLNGANKEGHNANYTQGLIACNALIAAIFAGLTSFLVYYLNSHRTSLISLSRGSVAGIVAISAVANQTRLWEAAFLGVLAGLIYIVLVMIVKRSHVDDPAQTLGAHFGPGLLGVIAVGFFNLNSGLLHGFGAKQLGLQLVGALAIIGWALLVAVFVVPLKGFGLFKINPQQEISGIDISYADGEAIHFADETPEPALLSVSPKKGIFQ